MSDTPRTDAEVDCQTVFSSKRLVNSDFARQLERDLLDARADRSYYRQLLSRVYHEAMDYDIDSRELDARILAVLGEEEQ